MTLIALIIAAGDNGREEFERATRYYKAQEYDAALPWFQRAYELSGRRATAIRGLAQCERNLKMYDEAIVHFREYLATNPGEVEAKSVKKTIALLEDLRAERNAARAKPPVVEKAVQESKHQRPPDPPVLVRRPVQPQLTPPAGTEMSVERPSTALPWITVGTSVAIAAGGTALFAIGIDDVGTVENAPDGTPYRGEIEDAADRAPVLTGLGIGLLIAGLTGAGAGVAWLIGQDDDEELAAMTSIQAGGQ